MKRRVRSTDTGPPFSLQAKNVMAGGYVSTSPGFVTSLSNVVRVNASVLAGTHLATKVTVENFARSAGASFPSESVISNATDAIGYCNASE